MAFFKPPCHVGSGLQKSDFMCFFCCSKVRKSIWICQKSDFGWQFEQGLIPFGLCWGTLPHRYCCKWINAGVSNLFQPRDPLFDRETEQGPPDLKKIKIKTEKMLRFKMSQLFLTYFILSHYHICKK